VFTARYGLGLYVFCVDLRTNSDYFPIQLFMLRTHFCILFFLVICNIFVLFNFVLFEDYALPCIHHCTTLRHAVARIRHSDA
jgi:hypothetical protein